MDYQAYGPRVDLHCHSGYSVDGYGTPESRVELAEHLGLAALSITDHNSTGATDRALKASRNRRLRYIPGVELDLAWEQQGMRCHFLCYWYQFEHEGLRRLTALHDDIYETQARWLLARLADTGLRVDEKRLEVWLLEKCPTPRRLSMWRIGDYLRDTGQAPADRSAVLHLLGLVGEDPPWPMPTVEEALPVIRSAKALVLLAHPGRLVDITRSVAPVRQLLEADIIDGFEMYHKSQREDLQLLEELESEFGCAVSGGSDCHDISRPAPDFGLRPYVPANVLDTMIDAYRRRYGTEPPM